jgi:hypothetical protein
MYFAWTATTAAVDYIKSLRKSLMVADS